MHSDSTSKHPDRGESSPGQAGKPSAVGQKEQLLRRIIYLNSEEYEALRKLSFDRKVSMSYLMRSAIRNELGLDAIEPAARGPRPRQDSDPK